MALFPRRWRGVLRFDVLFVLACLLTVCYLLLEPLPTTFLHISRGCVDPKAGYICRPELSQHWGQYSPYFSVPSEIAADVPDDCKVTFVQVLSRHGARFPTPGKSLMYSSTMSRLNSLVNFETLTGKYAFLKKYEYALGIDDLTDFGRRQLFDSGAKFFTQYRPLTDVVVPFIRASGQERVEESADFFAQGFHHAKRVYGEGDDKFPYPILVIPETPHSNNTLNHGICDSYEYGEGLENATQALDTWRKAFIPSIQHRLETDLGLDSGALDMFDVITLMELCPFETVAHPSAQLSPFCELFTSREFEQYNYYYTLEKFYRYGSGHPLGPTQGVGFANELLARLTLRPVNDHTTTNSTLDSDPHTFPLDDEHVVFADFSHDNDMTTIFFALGLYDGLASLPAEHMLDAEDTKGWSSAWAVPFASRAYVEKLKCEGYEEERVRVLVNDRVLPLQVCGGDARGMCSLTKFVESQEFARTGGRWDECFKDREAIQAAIAKLEADIASVGDTSSSGLNHDSGQW